MIPIADKDFTLLLRLLAEIERVPGADTASKEVRRKALQLRKRLSRKIPKEQFRDKTERAPLRVRRGNNPQRTLFA